MLQASVLSPPASGAADAASLPPLPPLPALRIGLLGLGTVGAGTYRVLTRNRALIRARSGFDLSITRVAVRDPVRAATLVDPSVQVGTDPFAVVTDPNVDVVVEVMGGTTLARALVLQAIAHGKPVVTANKALLAAHGTEIFAAAAACGVVVAYEAAVAVSIPIIKALREGLVANRVDWVAGIVNGTSNFILSEMRSKGIPFAAALQDAQARGYAEADPRFDVDGIDAAHKLCLLAANAFGTALQFAQVHTEGIASLQAADMVYAEQLGYRIKLLALARRQAAGLELRVHPVLLPRDHLLAAVEGSMNAVLVGSDAAGTTLYYGAGAGAEQTASAVIADLVDVARAQATPAQVRVPALGFQPAAQRALPLLPAADARSRYYLRLDSACADVLAPQLGRHLADCGVAVQTQQVLAHAHDATLQALVVQTRPVADGVLRQALQAWTALPAAPALPVALRMEALD